MSRRKKQDRSQKTTSRKNKREKRDRMKSTKQVMRFLGMRRNETIILEKSKIEETISAINACKDDGESVRVTTFIDGTRGLRVMDVYSFEIKKLNREEAAALRPPMHDPWRVTRIV